MFQFAAILGNTQRKKTLVTDYVLKENCLFILCAQLSYTPDNLI